MTTANHISPNALRRVKVEASERKDLARGSTLFELEDTKTGGQRCAAHVWLLSSASLGNTDHNPDDDERPE